MKIGPRPLKCPHCGKWARSPEEVRTINHKAFVFSVKFAVVFAILLFSIIGISILFEMQQVPSQDIHPFIELEEYLRLYEERHNISYGRIIYHFGDDSITVDKRIMEQDGAPVYYVYHTEELIVDINDGNEYTTTKFYIAPETIHMGNATYPTISFLTKFDNHDLLWYWKCIPTGKQFSINLKEVDL